MADYYVKSGSGAIDYTDRAWVLGERMVPALANTGTNHLIARRWVWEVTTAGTSTAVPTWLSSTTQDVTTLTQNGVVWTARKPGFSSGTTIDWTFATTRLYHAIQAAVAGDTIFVSSAHAATQTTALTLTLVAGVSVLCVTENGASRPTALTTGASEACTGNVVLTLAGSGYIYGVTFSQSSSAATAMSIGGTSSGIQTLESCSFVLLGTGAAQIRLLGSIGGAHSTLVLKNPGVKFSAAGQYIWPRYGRLVIDGGSLLSGGTSPTNLIGSASDELDCVVSGLDLTNAAAGINLIAATGAGNGVIRFRNIKMPASWSGTIGASTGNTVRIEADNVDSAATNNRLWGSTVFGTIKNEATLVRTGGANDGVLAGTLVMDSSSSAGYPTEPLETREIARYYPGTAAEVSAWTAGASKTVTLQLIHNSQGGGTGGRLTNAEFSADVQYLGTASSTLGVFATSQAAALATPADLTDSTQAWELQSPVAPNGARANSTVYTAGNLITVASNSGRIFVCTTGGTSAGSEPAGFATAVDGDSVTDNTAVFKAMRRHSIALTVTPQMKGYLLAKCNLMLASKTVYLDPKLVVS